MMRFFSKFFVIACLCLFTIHPIVECSILVQNSKDEIEGCDSLLKLRPLRKLESDDLNTVFKSISDIQLGNNDTLYVCDSALNQVRVFDSDWKFLKTIGRRGKGPGDFIGPNCLGYSPGIGLAVLEFQGMRIQLFDQNGNAQGLIKLKGLLNWMDVTSKNEFILYNSYRTYRSRKLLFVINKKGKLLREIGNYHDPADNFFDSEKFVFALDDLDNIYVASMHAPVIRKYSSNGKLLQCITFEMPFRIPHVSIELMNGGEDVMIKNAGLPPIRRPDGSKVESKNPWRTCVKSIAVDSMQRIYVVSNSRLLTKEESRKTEVRVEGGINGISKIVGPTIDIEDYPICNRLLVFDKKGKIIATSPLKLPFSSPTIKGNRLFLVDDVLDSTVWEYEACFSK